MRNIALSSMLVQTKWLLADICPDPLKSWELGELCLIKKNMLNAFVKPLGNHD